MRSAKKPRAARRAAPDGTIRPSKRELESPAHAITGARDDVEPALIARRDAESVEDPLSDWPESGSRDDDAWLDDRDAPRDKV